MYINTWKKLSIFVRYQISNLHLCSWSSRDSIYTTAGLRVYYHKIRCTGYRKQQTSASLYRHNRQRFLFLLFTLKVREEKVLYVSQKTNPMLSCVLPSLRPCLPALRAPLLLIIRSYFKRAGASSEKHMQKKIEHAGQFALISNQCLAYVLWNQMLLWSRFCSERQNDLFIMAAKRTKDLTRESKESHPHLSLSSTRISQQASSSRLSRCVKSMWCLFWQIHTTHHNAV